MSYRVLVDHDELGPSEFGPFGSKKVAVRVATTIRRNPRASWTGVIGADHGDVLDA